MSNIQVGERIRELREKNNYTRDGLAEKVDISPKFLYEIESGKKGFSADTFGRLSQALSVSSDYILFGEEKRQQSVEKIVCVLEMFGPKQRSRMQEILKLLYEMCNSLGV